MTIGSRAKEQQNKDKVRKVRSAIRNEEQAHRCKGCHRKSEELPTGIYLKGTYCTQCQLPL
jgi:hypothetical protein